jgi:hypothetical protein
VIASADASIRLWQTAVAAVIVFLLALPAIARIARRRSNLRDVVAGSAVSAWDELSETAIDLGMQPTDALTPRQTASALGTDLGADPVAALARVRASLERESFAGLAGEPKVEDVRVVLHALRGRAGLVRRVVATVYPRSLVLRWRGARRDAARSRS